MRADATVVLAVLLVASACVSRKTTNPSSVVVDQGRTERGEDAKVKPAWPQYQEIPDEDVPKANSALVMTLAGGQVVELVQMRYGKAHGSRAPGFEPSPLKAAVDEVDTGLFYVDVVETGFDIDDNGLLAAVVAISGGGNLCEFNGDYYLVLALPNGRARSSKPFGGCEVFESAEVTSEGLLVRFREGSSEMVAVPSG